MAIVIGLFLIGPVALGSNVVVNMTTDALFPPGSGKISLRNAIATANASSTPTTITFDPTVFASAQTIALNTHLELSNTSYPTTITGPAAGVTLMYGGLTVDYQVTASVANITVSDASDGFDAFGALTLANVTISNCNYDGIFSNGGTLTLANVTITGCSGIGIDSCWGGSATLTNVILSGNGGGIYSSNEWGTETIALNNCTITGSSGFGILTRGNATLANVTISENNGGGILNWGNATLANVSISKNNGGGIISGGTATLINVTVSDNIAAHDTYANYKGAGICNTGIATLTNVTVSGNTGITNSFGSDEGGGIYNSGTATLTNVTISGNTAPGGSASAGVDGGGGIYNDTAGTVRLTNVTVSGNAAPGGLGTGSGGGGICNFAPPGNFTISNSIVAGNTADNFGPDVYGGFNSLGYNLIGKTDNSSGWNGTDRTGTIASPLSANLAVLANYGGPTQTMPPLSGSPAIDTGSNALIPPGVTTDQRGLPRIANGTVDIGACEYKPGVTDFTVSPDDPPPVYFGAQPVGGAAVQRTFTVRNVGQNSLTGTATVAAPFVVVSGGSYSLAPGASQIVTISFTPSVAGNYSRLVTFSASGVTATRRVTGAAVPPMGPTGTIHGKVTVAGSGVAVSGAKVQPYATSGGLSQPYGQPTPTNSLGDYSVPVAPGTYDVVVVPANRPGGVQLQRKVLPAIAVVAGGSVLANAALAQGTPESTDPKQTPVILVRGWGADENWDDGGADYWSTMHLHLVEAGIQHVWDCNDEHDAGIVNPRTGKPGHFINGELSVERNAETLLSYIQQKVAQCATPPAQINLVAHSMGGLITRQMLSNVRDGASIPHVDKVVMLSTPNAGSVLANDFVKTKSLASAELRQFPLSIFSWFFALQAEVANQPGAGWKSTDDLKTRNFVNGQSCNFSALNPWKTDTGTRLYLMGGSYTANWWDWGLTLKDRKLTVLRTVMRDLSPTTEDANDGFVTTLSARGWYDTQVGLRSQNTSLSRKCFLNANPALPFRDWGTNHAQALTDQRVWTWVGSVLAGTATASSPAPQTMPVPLRTEAEPTTLTRVEVDTLSGALARSGHREIAVPCDALSSFTLLLSYDAKAISFSLRNPSGATIQPSGFQPATGVQYVALDTTATAGGIACYTVSAPTTGTWTAVLDTPSTASATVPWTLRVYGFGALDIEPTGGSLFHPAEEVLLSCFVGTWAGDALTSVTGAVALAVLTGPAGGLTTCTLLDDGAHWDGRLDDAHYAGLAQGLTLAGDYEAVYRVNGTDPVSGAAFRRVKRGALSISSGAGFIAGNLSHRSFDIDGDGRAERIGLECQVSVAGATTGTLTCDLVDPSGTVRISAAQEFVRTAPGTTAVTLLFDNGAIGVPGVYGPWQVENLQFFEQRDGRAYWMDTWPGAYTVGVSLAGPGTYGGLQVTLAPPAAVTAGAQWRIVDDPTTTTEPCWRSSGAAVAGLLPGDYDIAFSPLTGWIAPTARTVTVVGGETSVTFATYGNPAQQYTVTFQTDGTPGATLTGATSQTVNDGADCTAVTANAPAGWHFAKWTKAGAFYSFSKTLTVRNVTEDMTLTATFAPGPPPPPGTWTVF